MSQHKISAWKKTVLEKIRAVMVALYDKESRIYLSRETGIAERTPYYWFDETTERVPSLEDLTKIETAVQVRLTRLQEAAKGLADLRSQMLEKAS